MSVFRTNVTFPVGEIQLEGVLGYHKNTEEAPGVVICHPHPQMGGSMDNNVVYALFDEFVEQGYVSLAFNFRGAGRSEGQHEGGEGEMKDVEGALQYLKALDKTGSSGLGLLGYSFAVAPPLGILTFDFIERYPGPFFFVTGDRDTFCPVEGQESLLRGPEGMREGKVISGADHFFMGQEKEAARYLCEHFRRWLPPGT